MARFNSKVETTKTVNLAGGTAHKLSPEYELYTTVCASVLADKYYTSADEQLKRITELVKQCDPEFVGNLAAYARNEMHLRSVPVVLAVLLARHHGRSTARTTFSRVIRRVDEITETFAFFSAINNEAGIKTKGAHVIKKMVTKRPNSMIRGIRDVFESGRFDEYQYAKYDRAGKAFSLRDALFLTHPTPPMGQKELFSRIANSELKTPDTWEVAISAAGKDNEKKSQAWVELVRSKKLGHMALLRNLRNLLKSVPNEEFVTEVCQELVRGAPTGKQFPFRYWSAFLALGDGRYDPFIVKEVRGALDACLKASIATLPQLKGRSLVACDVSGSMQTKISPKSQVSNIEIGLVLGAVLYANDPKSTLMGMFGDIYRPIEPSGHPLHDVQAILQYRNLMGYSTNGYLVLQNLLQKQTKLDNLLFFTDCQMYGADSFESLWWKYKTTIAPNCKLYMFDLSGGGTVPLKINGHDTFLISGWSDRIFEACERMSQGESALDIIKNYTGPEIRRKTVEDIDAD